MGRHANTDMRDGCDTDMPLQTFQFAVQQCGSERHHTNTGVIDRSISHHLRSYGVVLIGVRQIPLYSATSKWSIWKDYGVIIVI